MKYGKKMMLVPYVAPQSQPIDSKLNELQNQMGCILRKKSQNDDKIKLYNQALSRYIKQYDPNTLGLAPAVVNLIKKVLTYIENNNTDQSISKNSFLPSSSSSEAGSYYEDLSQLFKNNLPVNNEQNLKYKQDGEEKEEEEKDDVNEEIKEEEREELEFKIPSDLPKISDLHQKNLTEQTDKIDKKIKEKQVSFSDTELTEDDPFKKSKKLVRTPIRKENLPPLSAISKLSPKQMEAMLDYLDYDMAYGTQVAKNTRSQGQATHPDGLTYSTMPSKKTINTRSSTAKTTTTVAKTSKAGTLKNEQNKSKQSGRGIWLRKRFF